MLRVIIVFKAQGLAFIESSSTSTSLAIAGLERMVVGVNPASSAFLGSARRSVISFHSAAKSSFCTPRPCLAFLKGLPSYSLLCWWGRLLNNLDLSPPSGKREAAFADAGAVPMVIPDFA